jgi:hypothetical protein
LGNLNGMPRPMPRTAAPFKNCLLDNIVSFFTITSSFF